jgi:AcrR family transcriptional regulator
MTEPARPARRNRTDAVRNRQRVLDAAAVVLAERGVDATVPEVAAAAGVGKATVYRSFPTKEHLLAAIAGELLGDLAQQFDEAAASEDPAGGLAAVLRATARRHATDPLLGSALTAAVALSSLVADRERLLAAMDQVVAAGRAQGAVRADATADDLRVLFGGMRRMLTERDEHDPRVWERYAELIVAALRP